MAPSKTYVAKPTDRERNWLVVDASGKTLGRLATQIADVLRGKRKPEYTPHIDTGDFVVVINAEKVAVTGNKRTDKRYYRHSGYPGGLRSRTFEEMLARRPEEIIRLAVKGMMPRNRLARKQLTKLKIYAGPEHPHVAQKPADIGDRDLMADEPTPDEMPETPETSESEPQAPTTPDAEAAAFAEHLAVPTEDATEIAGAVEDAPLEAFEEAHVSQPPAAEQPAEAPAAAEPTAAEPLADEPAVQEPVAAGGTPAGEQPVAADEAGAAQQTPAEGAGRRGGGRRGGGGARPAGQARRARGPPRGRHRPRGVDPLGRDVAADPYAIEDEESVDEARPQDEEEVLAEPISTAAIDLAAGARYRATGKRKTAIARVTLRPGKRHLQINGRTLEEHFPRETLQRNIRQPLETVGYEERMDVVARLHGGGVSAQAGALRHGVSRALLEADPNLRGELKRRGFLTRDSRAKERKKAG